MLDERPEDRVEEEARAVDLPPDAPADAPAVEQLGPVARPLAVAALAASGAGFMTGGIFGEWLARGIGVFGALFGVGWAWLTLRSTRRQTVLQATLLPAAFALGVLSLVPTSDGPARVFSLMGDAVSSGRLLRPPVPFDPGWRPVLLILLATLGFITGIVAAGQKRPQLALLAALPILGLTAISQPAEGEFIGAIGGFLPILVALGLMFGGDGRVSELGRSFELKRALRSAPLLAGGLALVFVLGNSDFLFPKPVFNPAEKPQKPKSIPLGKVRDRVLFEIDGDLTGPWQTGVLDVYDGKAWRLPPFDTKRLKPLKDGTLEKGRVGDVPIMITVRDLGTSSVLPGVVGPTKVDLKRGDVVWDARAGVLRMKNGRVPADLRYTMTLAKYPTDEQLKDVQPARGDDRDLTYVPKAPPVVQQLLQSAPAAPWARLSYVRSKLNEVVIAVGAGEPSKDVPPSKVADLLNGSHEGSPFEIVAAETMLARWAGFPARIGFGFDGINDENGKKTVRPKNGSNWLEVHLDGYGWIPLIGQPPKAKSSLDPDDNTKFDPSILPSSDVAVELYVPVEVKGLRLLYQKIRALIAQVFPYALALAVAYLLAPATRRLLRRRRRRQWAQERGLRYEVAVEYCELRDALTDLNIGHSDDTPLELLQRFVDDPEHTELAWLVTRVMYGDLAFAVTDEQVEDARGMAASLRRRASRIQPFQSRALAFVSRASLRQPYTLEVPNVRRLPRPRRRPPVKRRPAQRGVRGLRNRIRVPSRRRSR